MLTVTFLDTLYADARCAGEQYEQEILRLRRQIKTSGGGYTSLCALHASPPDQYEQDILRLRRQIECLCTL